MLFSTHNIIILILFLCTCMNKTYARSQLGKAKLLKSVEVESHTEVVLTLYVPVRISLKVVM